MAIAARGGRWPGGGARLERFVAPGTVIAGFVALRRSHLRGVDGPRMWVLACQACGTEILLTLARLDRLVEREADPCSGRGCRCPTCTPGWRVNIDDMDEAVLPWATLDGLRWEREDATARALPRVARIRRILWMIRRLPSSQRVTLRMWLAGMRRVDIARTRGVKKPTVTISLRRAVANLRRLCGGGR
jgi:hypothetical protein